MDIDDELRRMFANLDYGDRLDIPVRPGADLVIVAGARLLRRRRYVAATVGAVAVAILVGGGIAVAVNGTRNSMPPAETTTERTTDLEATTTTTTTTTTTAPRLPAGPPTAPKTDVEAPPPPPVGDPDEPTSDQPPPPLTDGELTASGYGPFELGMSTDDALATGLLRLDSHGGSCARYTINGGGSVLISAQLGITRFDLPPRVRTPEGLGASSTVGEVRAAYSGTEDYRAGVTAPASPAASYEFVTVETPNPGEPVPDTFVVGDLRLAATSTDCAQAM